MGFPIWNGEPREAPAETVPPQQIEALLKQAAALDWPELAIASGSIGPGEDRWKAFGQYLASAQPTSGAKTEQRRSYQQALQALQSICCRIPEKDPKEKHPHTPFPTQSPPVTSEIDRPFMAKKPDIQSHRLKESPPLPKMLGKTSRMAFLHS